MTTLTCLIALSLLTASVPSPHTPITPGSAAPAVRSQADARRLARHARHARHAHRLTVSGSVVLIASGAAWGLMIGAMTLGVRERRHYNELVATVNGAARPPHPGERDGLAFDDRYGSRDNTGAIVSAIVGSAMTIVGAALLGRGLALRKRQGRLAPLRVAASWRPTL